MLKWIVVGAALALAAMPARAGETVTYSYDALGRLVKTTNTNTSGANAGLTQGTQYDPAGNRVRVTVTGSTNTVAPGTGVVVLPLNGFTIIPVGAN